MPIRKAGAGSTLAALVTFVASGLFHEYQFVLSFANYQLGGASLFFVMQGSIATAETLITRALGQAAPSLPPGLRTALVLIVFSPTVTLFSQIWIREGMFDVILALVPRFVVL